MAALVKSKLGYLRTNFSSFLVSKASSFQKRQKLFFHCSPLIYGEGQELKMPSLSPTMTEGKIVKWLKKEGDPINPGDVLCDIETDKAVVSMEVEEEGILAKILVAENTPNVKVGSLIGLMVSQGEDWKNVDIPAGAVASPSDSSVTSSSSSEPTVSGSCATPIKMPSLSPTMTSGTIIKWLKKEGDELAAGDVLCDIQTDKAVISMEAEDDGILAKIIMPNDSKDIAVGTVIAMVVPLGEDWKCVTVPSQEPSEVKEDVKASPVVSTEATSIKEVKGKSYGPAVRLLLSLYQLDPGLIESTGRSNRLLKEDVLKYISNNNLKKKSPVALPSSEVTSTAGAKQKSTAEKAKSASPNVSKYIDIETSNVRQVIAKRLLESKQNIPHSYSAAKCNINNLLETKNSLLNGGIKVTLNDLLTKATALALQLYPKANAQLINQEVKLSERVDISVAVSTDRGLFTPVVKSTNMKDVVTISQEIKELSTKAKSGQLKPEDFQGGTFTISNLGMFGITHFKAIINPPQCGILAVGGLIESLNNNLVPQKHIILTLSYDRRALDEIEAAKFMDILKYFIEMPKIITSDMNHLLNQEL